MINIAYISSYPFSLQFGGMEIQLLSYRNYMNEMFKDVINIQMIDMWDREKAHTYDVVHLFGQSNWYCDLIRVLKANYQKAKIVISPTFYCPNENSMSLAAKISKIIPIPNYFSYKKMIYDNCDAVVVNSIAERSQLIKIFNITENKFNVVYNFVEEGFSEHVSSRANDAFLAQNKLDGEYLLCVGFMDDRKNTFKLVQAYLNVADKINKKLVLIGDYRFRRRSENEELRKLIDSNRKSIVHIPYVNRESNLLKSAYKYCAAHVMPSIIETPGIANLEAAVFNKPILVGDCKPVREYFGDNAVYCNPRNLKSIQNGIMKVVDNKDGERIGNFVRQKYNEKISISTLGSVYLKLAGKTF